MPRFSSEIYNIFDELILSVNPDFDIPRGTNEQIDFFQQGMQTLKESGSFKNVSSNIYQADRSLSSDELISLIWSYMDIKKIEEYGVARLKLEIAKAIGGLANDFHIVQNVYPVGYAQKM